MSINRTKEPHNAKTSDFHVKESRVSLVLIQLMKESDLTEAELSRQTGIPQATLNRILLGGTEDPRASTLKILAKFFDITVDQMLGLEPINPQRIAGSYSPHIRSSFTSVPVIPWEKINHWLFERGKLNPYSSGDWIVTERLISQNSYAVRSLSFMRPRFRLNSILVIDPEIKFSDGHFIIIAFDGINPTVRRVIKDGAITYLKKIQGSQELEKLEASHRIFGTIVETRIDDYSTFLE